MILHSFFFVIIILMNILFGIIIDTFGELRAIADSIQEDINNKCFICEIERREFDRHSQVGFEQHIQSEHNMWHYLAFSMHLKRTQHTEYTGPEQYVSKMIEEKDWRFIPHLCALSINYAGDEEEEDQVQDLEEVYCKLQDLDTKHSVIGDNLQKLTTKLVAIENHSESVTLLQNSQKRNSTKSESLHKLLEEIEGKLAKATKLLEEIGETEPTNT